MCRSGLGHGLGAGMSLPMLSLYGRRQTSWTQEPLSHFGLGLRCRLRWAHWYAASTLTPWVQEGAQEGTEHLRGMAGEWGWPDDKGEGDIRVSASRNSCWRQDNNRATHTLGGRGAVSYGARTGRDKGPKWGSGLPGREDGRVWGRSEGSGQGGVGLLTPFPWGWALERDPEHSPDRRQPRWLGPRRAKPWRAAGGVGSQTSA